MQLGGQCRMRMIRRRILGLGFAFIAIPGSLLCVLVLREVRKGAEFQLLRLQDWGFGSQERAVLVRPTGGRPCSPTILGHTQRMGFVGLYYSSNLK